MTPNKPTVDEMVKRLERASEATCADGSTCNAFDTDMLDDAAALLKTLQAENERLRAEGNAWRNVAHQAAGNIDCLLLYATTHPTDSHSIEANTFLIQLRAALGIKKPHRTQGQFKDKGYCLPPFPAALLERNPA